MSDPILKPESSPDVLQVLTPLLTSCSDEEEEDSSFFLPRCTPSGGFQEVQCRGPECWCVDREGQEVVGSRTVGRPSRCPSPCERALITALKKKSNMAAGAELLLPACSEGGDFLPLQCAGPRCFCVDADGNPTTGPAEGAVTCKKRNLYRVKWNKGLFLTRVYLFLSCLCFRSREEEPETRTVRRSDSHKPI